MYLMLQRWSQTAAGYVLAGTVFCFALSWTIRFGDKPRPGQEPNAPERAWREDLEWKSRGPFQRIETKRRIALEVLAGRMTLAEAIARYRALNGESSHDFSVTPRVDHRSEERLGREVIEFVYDALEGRPDPSLSRLQQELCEYLACPRVHPTDRERDSGRGVGVDR